jgi:hypothetical protein
VWDGWAPATHRAASGLYRVKLNGIRVFTFQRVKILAQFRLHPVRWEGTIPPVLDGLLERAGTNLIAGVWIADLSRSKQHPLQELQSAKLEIAVIGETATIVDEIVDASGRKERHENILAADGGEHPSPYGGYQIVATWMAYSVSPIRR